MVRLSPLVHTKYLKNYGISFTCLIGPDIKEITPIVLRTDLRNLGLTSWTSW
jgi:hypothetical protein